MIKNDSALKNGGETFKSDDGGINDKKDDCQNASVSFNEHTLDICGYRFSRLKLALVWIFVIVTGGILRLFFHWYKHWYLYCTQTKCFLRHADTVLITETFKENQKRLFIKKVKVKTVESARAKSHSSSSSLGSAENGQVNNLESIGSLCKPLATGGFTDVASIRYFDVKKARYVWCEETNKFTQLKALGIGDRSSDIHACHGLSPTEQWKRRILYGHNFIQVPVSSYWKLFVLEFFRPFYMFQVFSVVLWFIIDYYAFATAIVIMASWGLIVSIRQTKQNQTKLAETIQGSDTVNVLLENGSTQIVNSESLVPGDVIVLPFAGCVLHCDAALLTGTAIVNESMLTGESIPMMKTALPNRSDVIFNEKEHSRHTLYCGTRIIQARFFEGEKVLAVVLRTGYMTVKGNLVSSILYPLPVDFQFERDSLRFIAVLTSVAFCGVITNIIRRFLMGEYGFFIILRSLDVITIGVPPALPAAMTIGSFYAAKRLVQQSIFCINPRVINIAGSLDLVCFDKTGTLTDDGMDFWGVLPTIKSFFTSERKASLGSHTEDSGGKPSRLVEGMATCHSLTYIEGELAGDPLELKVFEATSWTYEELQPDDFTKYDVMVNAVAKWKPNIADPEKNVQDCVNDHIVGIVKVFPFASALQRSSVVTKVLGSENFAFYCKGSPEVIHSLCLPETVPPDFHDTLGVYTKQGFRVIAFASGEVKGSILKIERLQREELEVGLTFLGFVILENKLKPETIPALRLLNEAGIRSVMVTGDNLDTAISVGRNCGLIGPNEVIVEVSTIPSAFEAAPSLAYRRIEQEFTKDDISYLDYSLAMDGKTFDAISNHHPEMVPKILARGAIFARMKPDQKQELVIGFQEMDYCVGMCGDGANDCGALKAAHAGIALTETEASVASPFTSKEASIACVPKLIRECRCALVTSFGMFKYMAAYSLIQFTSVMILYEIGTNLTDLEFLYIDLFLITAVSAVFALTLPYEGKLHPKPPTTSLISLGPLASIVTQLVLFLISAFLSLELTKAQPWYVPYAETENLTADGFLNSPKDCFENFAIFAPSQFVYIALAITFSKGFPYRKAFYTNLPFATLSSVLTILAAYILFYPADFIQDSLELELPPSMEFRAILLAIGLGSMVVSILGETFLVDWFICKVCIKWKNALVGRKKKRFELIRDEIDSDPGWQPRNMVETSRIEVKVEPCGYDNNAIELRSFS